VWDADASRGRFLVAYKRREMDLYNKNEILNAMETCLDDHEKVIFKSRHGVESDSITIRTVVFQIQHLS